ncbi:MAG: double-strand break repair protein AddB [Alphaproteobacteria bacterium]|nr:double-strand break repair protein AddB [Alphaproteobacteria bacterium]
MPALKDTPLVYNIPAGQSFADALARGVWEMAKGDPLALGGYTVLLPSRRACRTLREAFLRLSGGKGAVLPRMQPIGDVEADEVTLLLSADAEAPDIPPAVSRLQRQLLLARAIMQKDKTQSFDQAAALALELGRFLDEVQTEGLSFDGLKDIVPERFADHWQETLTFLRVLTDVWPGVLESRGVIDYAARRNMLLDAQKKAWELHPPQNPVIAAGSTGTVPAAAELLSLVARLPQGMLVLPGMDAQLDEISWDMAGPEHPQYNIKQLLARIGIDRDAVADWPVEDALPVNTARVRLLSEAMRPPATTEKWRDLTPDDIPPQALEGFIRIDCDTAQEEADVIALILRETLEEKGKTAALITPDRRLARRVSMALKRWGIDIDDTGGQPLTETPAGAWLMLGAEAAEQNLAPVQLLSLLKHPVMAAGLPPAEHAEMVSMLDRLVLRGPRPSPGFAGLRDGIALLADKAPDTAQKLSAWCESVSAIVSPFAELMQNQETADFRALVTAHIHMAENLANAPGATGAERLWTGEAGEAATRFFAELLEAANDVPPLARDSYVALVRTLLKGVTVRPRYGTHPRLSILGQVEARLYSADLVILGGLNEGTWPAKPAEDPWMSRPMRRDFGLPPPERGICLDAHDFVQAASAPEVIVTRAKKVDGSPAVPARWLLRMETVLQAAGIDMNDVAAKRYRQWARDLDAPDGPPVPPPRPAPCPPVHARPREMRVTRVEAWVRDPYQIYAQYVLGLDALDPVDADPGGAERGTFVHKALEDFVRAYPEALPDDAVEKLLQFGRDALDDMRVPDEVAAFWWPRFMRIADGFVEQERAWRQTALPVALERRGKWVFDAKGGLFTLTGTADRIDRAKSDGSYVIIDYKTGAAPTKTEVRNGLSPQLPLESLMLSRGAFGDDLLGGVSDLVHWKVTGSGKKPVEQISPCDGKVTAEDLAQGAEDGLLNLITAFNDETTPYYSQPRAEALPRFSDYDHLARVREWRVSGDAEDAA